MSNCPKCGAEPDFGEALCVQFDCGSIGVLPGFEKFTQSDACRIRELEQQLAAVTAERDAAQAKLNRIESAAQADEDDLNQMRDGTKLTRRGVVQIIAYQQEDIAELTAERDALRAEVDRLRRVAEKKESEVDAQINRSYLDW